MKFPQPRFLAPIVLTLFALAGCEDQSGSTKAPEELFPLPAYLINHVGFDSDDNALALPGLNPDAPAFPMFPLYKSQFASKKFVGAVIPAKFLDGEKASGPRGMIVMGVRPPTGSKAAHAMNLISQVKMDDGVSLRPYYYNGKVFGIRSDIPVMISNSTTVGIGITFGGDSVNLGDEFVLGANLHVGGLKTTLGQVSGVNFADSLQGVLDGTNLVFSGDDAEKVISQGLAFYPYIAHYLAANGAKETLANVPTGSEARFKSTLRMKLGNIVSTVPNLSLRIDSTKFSQELQDARGALAESATLGKEIEWKKKVKWAAETTKVTMEERDQAFLQEVCDYLAQSYEIPRDIWPKCRIAATAEPNAYAYPGGDIFFTAGLLGILSDLDSVMLVLGHEIGHVVGRHTTKRMPAINALNFSASTLGITANVFSLGAGWGQLGSVTYLNWFPKSMATAQVSGVAANLVLQTGVAALMAHSRGAEWQADRFGQQVAYASGADLSAMDKGWGEFIGFFKKYYGVNEGFFKRIMASHPDGDDRKESFQENAEEIQANLSAFNAANRLPEAYYQEYKKIHAAFKPLAEYVGERALLKRNQKGAELSLKTLELPGGACALEALSR